jgi:hypothetical protein
MSVLSSIAYAVQERELEKVNAFYLQKEAEVSLPPVLPQSDIDLWKLSLITA